MATFAPLSLSCLCLDASELGSLYAHLAAAKTHPRRIKPSKRPGVVKDQIIKTKSGTLKPAAAAAAARGCDFEFKSIIRRTLDRISISFLACQPLISQIARQRTEC
jgi:hypothetical protein